MYPSLAFHSPETNFHMRQQFLCMVRNRRLQANEYLINNKHHHLSRTAVFPTLRCPCPIRPDPIKPALLLYDKPEHMALEYTNHSSPRTRGAFYHQMKTSMDNSTEYFREPYFISDSGTRDQLSPSNMAAIDSTTSSTDSPELKRSFSCPQCKYTTDRKNNLKRHIITMHFDCDRKLECCGANFRSKAKLREHVILFHKDGYRCMTCSRIFCRKALLRRHMSVHSGRKDFLCNQCDYATSHKSNLERHQKVHLKSGDSQHNINGDAHAYRTHRKYARKCFNSAVLYKPVTDVNNGQNEKRPFDVPRDHSNDYDKSTMKYDKSPTTFGLNDEEVFGAMDNDISRERPQNGEDHVKEGYNPASSTSSNSYTDGCQEHEPSMLKQKDRISFIEMKEIRSFGLTSTVCACNRSSDINDDDCPVCCKLDENCNKMDTGRDDLKGNIHNACVEDARRNTAENYHQKFNSEEMLRDSSAESMYTSVDLGNHTNESTIKTYRIATDKEANRLSDNMPQIKQSKFHDVSESTDCIGVGEHVKNEPLCYEKQFYVNNIKIHVQKPYETIPFTGNDDKENVIDSQSGNQTCVKEAVKDKDTKRLCIMPYRCATCRNRYKTQTDFLCHRCDTSEESVTQEIGSAFSLVAKIMKMGSS